MQTRDDGPPHVARASPGGSDSIATGRDRPIACPPEIVSETRALRPPRLDSTAEAPLSPSLDRQRSHDSHAWRAKTAEDRRPPRLEPAAPQSACSADDRSRTSPSGERRRVPATRGAGARLVSSASRPAYAALDLGTNNCRLLVAEPLERGFRVTDAFSRIVRLGEGVGATGRLAQAAMDRAVAALRVCRRKLDQHDIARLRCIATEACRVAVNGRAFIERVHAETGLALEIVTRETEARLAVTSCATLIDPEVEGVVLFDIGGGSSEVVWLDLSRGGALDLDRAIRGWVSIPVGVVTLSERHGGVRVGREVFADMVAEVDRLLARFPQSAALTEALSRHRFHMLGTSGTVTTLAGVHLDLPRYDRRRVDGVWLDRGDVDRMLSRFLAMSYEERVENPCIGADRADLVLAGCAIFEAIRRRWPCPRLRVADRGLREGILTELMAADGVWRPPAGNGAGADGAR